TIDAGPASPDSAAGRVKIPEPTMLPMTSAVAIQRPIDLFSRGLSVGVDMTPPFSDARGVRVQRERPPDRHLARRRCTAGEPRSVQLQRLRPVRSGQRF